MERILRMGLVIIAAVLVLGVLPGIASAQMVPESVDPYELAPQNVHLYPVSLNAREPYYYLPPIFAPAPMWRGALSEAEINAFAPHNFVAYEIPDSTALTAWGTTKGDKRFTLEAANQQEFMILPPEAQRGNNASYYLIKTGMRFLPKCSADDLQEILMRELSLEPGTVDSIAQSLPTDVLQMNYDRVEDVANLQPPLNAAIRGELGTSQWPVDEIYISYNGFRREPNRIRTLPDTVPNWFTCKGKLLALKHHDGQAYLMTVEFEGYEPWYPIEVAKNVMRKMIALSFNEYVETTPYYDFEKPLNGKEWQRHGDVETFNTWSRAGSGSAGQGAY
ncbi:MAG: hypothetical protein R3F46_04930 [bacterium]